MNAVSNRAAAFLLILSLLLAGANLFWTAHEVNAYQAGQQRIHAAQQAAQRREQAAQKKQGEQIERKLCITLAGLEPLAGLSAPAGNPVQNPSRAYEQKLNNALKPLAQLGPDLGCK